MAKNILPPPELTRLHRLTDKEADLILDYRLLHPEHKLLTADLINRLTCQDDPTADNVVRLRG